MPGPSIQLQAEVKLRSHLALNAKPAGGGKPFLKGKFGLEFFRKTRAWHHVGRTIDRRGNRYSERITDEAGNIVREVDEHLSDHRGRGSAKRAGSTDCGVVHLAMRPARAITLVEPNER